MKSNEIRKRLGISASVLKKLVDEGLPFAKNGRARDFDVVEVDGWLVKHGYAEPDQPTVPPPSEVVCETYADLAKALGMTGRDPNRTIASWATQPGFPGTSGTPGKRNARLPVEQIREWLAGREGGGEFAKQDDELRQLDRERRRLQIEFENRKLREQLDRLADVDEVAQFNRQCASDAQAMLRPLADEVVALLPSRTAARIRAQIHKKVTALLDDAFEAIARITRGDTDGEEETHDKEADQTKGKSKGKTKAKRRRAGGSSRAKRRK
jgi:hypothetical protein